MATFIIHRRYTDFANTGSVIVKPLFVFTGADSSDADDVCGRLNRAARTLFQFVRHESAQRLPDQQTWQDAAAASLGALDPETTSNPDNLLFDAKYFVTEVHAFSEPSEDPPASEQERIVRDIRDLDPAP